MAFTMTVAAWSVIDYSLGYSSAGKYMLKKPKFFKPLKSTIKFYFEGQLQIAQNMVKWGSDYLIKAHVAPSKLYGQVGDAYADHSYWGRPEDMTMARPVTMG